MSTAAGPGVPSPQDGGGDSVEPPATAAQLRALLLEPRRPRRLKIGQLLIEAGALHDTGLQRVMSATSQWDPGGPLDVKVGGG